MRTLKLVVAYDGTNYHGFQKQPDIVTVQGILEDALSKFCGEEVATAGSGRTDAGVHARGQVVSLKTNGRIPCDNLVRASRTMLPKDIVILSCEEAEDGFHARHSARWKRYCYRVHVGEKPDPFLVNYTWQLCEAPDVAAMNEAASLLLGTHNFQAFQSSGSVEGDPVKTIYKAEWEQNASELTFTIEGNGFVYHMVRNLVWTLVQIGLGRRTAASLAEELGSQRTEFLNAPAPAQGLYLDYVGYENM